MARPKKKEILRLLKENAGNNIFFTAILCIEVIFLGILLFKAVFTPGVSFRHAASDFRYEDTSNVKAEEESLIFLPAEKISDAFAKLGISENVRAEELTPADFSELYKAIK